MYKHILLPTDGTILSESAVRAGISLAREQGAKVTALYVMSDYRAVLFGADALMTYDHSEFERVANKEANTALQFVEHLALQEGVPCELTRSSNLSIYQAIVNQAKESACDLICMASHGRKGISGILLGSETQKVLTHTNIPVLVHRQSHELISHAH